MMLSQFVALQLIGLAYFHFILSSKWQSFLLKLINQMREYSDRKVGCEILSSFSFVETKHHFQVYCHCLSAIAWVPIWHYLNIRNIFDNVVGFTWFQNILGEPYDPAVKLNMWKWCAGLVIAVAERDLTFIVNAVVVLLYFFVKSVKENATHTLHVITEVEKYCVVSSKSVSMRKYHDALIF